MQPSPNPMFQQPAFDPDTIRVMSAAFDDICHALSADRRDLASRLIARKIIELARGGERDRARLCGETLAYFGLDGSAEMTHAPGLREPGSSPRVTP